MHHIYLYEVEKSVLISRLLKVMKSKKKRSPFDAVDEKRVQTRASNGVFYKKTFAKNLDSRKYVGGRGRSLISTRHYFVSLYLLINDYGG